MSRRDSLLDAIVAALGAAGKPASLTIDRQRSVPLAQSQLPSQSVYAIAEEVKTGPARGLDNKRLARRYLQVCVETRVDASGSTPDQALDPYVAWAVKAVCGTQQLASIAHDVQELGTTWDQDEEDAVLASAKQVFLVEYVTSASDMDAATAG
jgi:hypothetical protein